MITVMLMVVKLIIIIIKLQKVIKNVSSNRHELRQVEGEDETFVKNDDDGNSRPFYLCSKRKLCAQRYPHIGLLNSGFCVVSTCFGKMLDRCLFVSSTISVLSAASFKS